MSGRTPINITSQAVYTNVDESDDLFNIFAGVALLLGNDIFTDDALAMSGLARFRAPSTIDDGLTLENTVTLVNATVLKQNGDLVLGESSSDAVTVRNIAGATWELANGADITGAGASEFVNLGLLELTAGTATIDANFYDRGGTIEAEGTLVFNSPGDVNRFVDDTIIGDIELTGGVLDGSTITAGIVDLVDTRIVGDVTITSTTFDAATLNLGAGSVLDLGTQPERVPVYGNVTLGEVIGSGDIEIGVDYFVNASSVTLVGAVTLDNAGLNVFGPQNGTAYGTSITTNAWAGDQITIENLGHDFGNGVFGTAFWNAQGSFAQYTAGGAGNTLFYIGYQTIYLDDTENGSTFSMDVVNDDGMSSSAPNGGFTFNDPVSGTGGISGALITVNASMGSGQEVSLTSVSGGPAAPTLTLNDLQEFSGLITGFDQNGATNDQIVANTATWQYQDFVPNSGGTGGALMFTNGSAEAAVNLTGSYDPLGFQGAVSGGTTTITYTG